MRKRKRKRKRKKEERDERSRRERRRSTKKKKTTKKKTTTKKKWVRRRRLRPPVHSGGASPENRIASSPIGGGSPPSAQMVSMEMEKLRMEAEKEYRVFVVESSGRRQPSTKQRGSAAASSSFCAPEMEVGAVSDGVRQSELSPTRAATKGDEQATEVSCLRGGRQLPAGVFPASPATSPVTTPVMAAATRNAKGGGGMFASNDNPKNSKGRVSIWVPFPVGKSWIDGVFAADADAGQTCSSGVCFCSSGAFFVGDVAGFLSLS